MQEFARLRWEQIDLARRVLHIWRLKHGLAADHPIPQREAANLLRLAEGMKPSELVFPAPRGGPWSEPAWTYRLRRAARAAGLEHLGVHPHMLRHACGYYLTNERGWDIHRVAAYLGHRKLEVTRGYAQLAPRQFAGAWEDV
jgi:type 1 fimbriae regulatory protein FimB/type 1 fimbriae regulatory protein FimE